LIETNLIGGEFISVVSGNFSFVLKEDFFSIGIFKSRFEFNTVFSFPGFELRNFWSSFNLSEHDSGCGEDSQKKCDLF